MRIKRSESEHGTLPIYMAADSSQKQAPRKGGGGEEGASGGDGAKKMAKKGKDLKEEMDNLVETQRRETERLGDVFERAAQDTKSQADKFDDLFQSALEEAKNDEDKKPPSPFDLDGKLRAARTAAVEAEGAPSLMM